MRWKPFEKMDRLVHPTLGTRPIPDDEVYYRNNVYEVCVRALRGNIENGASLSIKRTDKRAVHDWRDFQRIKNLICGPEYEAFEVYPAESRLVDTSNQYWLWVLPKGERMPVGFNERMVVEDTTDSNAVQRQWPTDARPKDLRKLTLDDIRRGLKLRRGV